MIRFHAVKHTHFVSAQMAKCMHGVKTVADRYFYKWPRLYLLFDVFTLLIIRSLGQDLLLLDSCEMRQAP
jgi:hypothetical protein